MMIEHRAWSQAPPWVQNNTSCVTLGTLINLTGPQFCRRLVIGVVSQEGNRKYLERRLALCQCWLYTAGEDGARDQSAVGK